MHGLVGDTGHARPHELVRELRFCGQVEVREHEQIVTEVPVFARHRFLDLQKQVGDAPGGVGVGGDLSAGGRIMLVGDG